jgi:hypothetical protein
MSERLDRLANEARLNEDGFADIPWEKLHPVYQKAWRQNVVRRARESLTVDQVLDAAFPASAVPTHSDTPERLDTREETAP